MVEKKRGEEKKGGLKETMTKIRIENRRDPKRLYEKENVRERPREIGRVRGIQDPCKAI